MELKNRLIANQLSHNGGCRDYVAYPSLQRPRWILPADPCLKKAGFKLCTPHAFKGKILKKLWEYGLLPGDKVGLEEGYLKELKAELSKLHDADIFLAFYIGTPGTFQKVTALCLNGLGGTLSYAKIAFEPFAKLALQQESVNLRKAWSQAELQDHVPQILAEFQLLDSLILVTSAGPEKTAGSALLNSHKEFLGKLNRSFAANGTLKESNMWCIQQKTLSACRHQMSVKWLERYDCAFNTLNKYSDVELTFTLAHRDFVPWNTRCRPDGALYVFDWEFSQDGYLPTHDLFHFQFMTSLMLEKNISTGQVKKWVSCPKGERGGSDFLAYLVDTALFYQKSAFDRGDFSDDAVLRAIANLLDHQHSWNS